MRERTISITSLFDSINYDSGQRDWAVGLIVSGAKGIVLEVASFNSDDGFSSVWGEFIAGGFHFNYIVCNGSNYGSFDSGSIFGNFIK